MTFAIKRGDLAATSADVVVVPANTCLEVCGGAGEDVARAAGMWRVRRACRRLGGCAVGEAVATPGFKLRARNIVHAVGPVWVDGSHGEEELLERTYANALELADRLGAASVALPLLATGAHGYPVRGAFEVAVRAVRAFLDEREMDVELVLSDHAVAQAGELYDEVAAYVRAEWWGADGPWGAGPAASASMAASSSALARSTGNCSA